MTEKPVKENKKQANVRPMPVIERRAVNGKRPANGKQRPAGEKPLGEKPPGLVARLDEAIREDLLRAGIVSGALAYWKRVGIAGFAALGAGAFAALVFPEFWWAGAVAPVAVLVAGITIPRFRWKIGRRGRIDEELPYMLSFMTIMAQSNTPADKIFTSLARMKTMKAVAPDAAMIVRETNLFGIDVLSAMEAAARNTPSEAWSAVLEGMARTVRTGGDRTTFLAQALRTSFAARTVKLDALLEVIGTYADTYATMLTGLLAGVLMAVMMGATGGADVIGIFYLLIYLALPATAAVIWLMVDRARSAGVRTDIPRRGKPN